MIKDNKELLYELTLASDGDEVFAVSFVAEPAIERDFVYMNKAEVKFQAIDNDKHLVAGPLLIPSKKILRLDEKNQPYYVFFKPETIEQIAQKYLSKKYNDSVTYEHSVPVKDVSLVESWVVESPTKDKSNIYGFTMPKGTWFGIFKVNNPELWKDVKAGKVKGFSIEGAFEHKEAMMSAVLEKDIEEFTEEEAEIFLGMVKNIIKKDKRYSKGERLVEESHSDYSSAVRSNAKKGIALNEKNGNKCATQVGKVRAQQLAKGDPVSTETVKRMYSYLSRAETYYDNADKNSDCGYISFLLWGGKSGLSWSRNKLRKLGLLEEAEAAQPSFPGGSSYPGEISKKKKDYIHPALIGEKK